MRFPRLLGFLLLLALALCLAKAAKLAPMVGWSWWACTAPVWGAWVLLSLAATLTLLWAILTTSTRTR